MCHCNAAFIQYLLVVGGHGFPRLYTGKIAERLSQLHSAGLLYHYTLSSTEFKKTYIQCNKKVFLDI